MGILELSYLARYYDSDIGRFLSMDLLIADFAPATQFRSVAFAMLR